jgi:hypothetical protein
MMEMSTPRPLSALLEEIRSHLTAPQISASRLLELFHERGFGFFLLLISLPAALPLPALGLNTIIAFPLLLLTAQQMAGRHTVWLPARWHAKTLSSATLEKFIDTSLPWVGRIEWIIRPRLGFMTHGIFSHAIGIAGFIMALAVLVPVPFTNTVPSFGIACMAIGVLMRDGLAVLAGMVVGLSWCLMLMLAFIFFGSEAISIVRETISSYL